MYRNPSSTGFLSKVTFGEVVRLSIKLNRGTPKSGFLPKCEATIDLISEAFFFSCSEGGEYLTGSHLGFKLPSLMNKKSSSFKARSRSEDDMLTTYKS